MCESSYARALRKKLLPAIAALGILVVAGCQRQPAARDASSASPAPLTADAVLDQMVEAYQSAEAYSDHALLKLKVTEEGVVRHQQAPMSVALVRPNRLSARVYHLSLACDGERLRARINDEPSNNVDHQFVDRAAPAPLTLDAIYSDQLLHGAMLGGMAGHPVQLELLLADEPLAMFRNPDAQKTLTQGRPLGNKICHHIAVQTAHGKFGLWIEPKTHLLRRLDYPHSPETGAELFVEFDGAAFAPPTRERFQLPAAPHEKTVEHFVPPPQPLPSDLFGKTIENFAFASSSGAPVTSQSLAGKAAVLAWFQDHPGCQANLAQLQDVQKQFANDDRLAFYAVSSDVTMSAAQIERLLQGWNIELAALLDPQLHGRDLFRIREAPTVVVLGPQGKLHFFEMRNNPDLARVLPEVLQRILGGEDIGGDIAWRYEQEQTRYERSLAIAMGDKAAAATPLTELAARSTPRQLTLTKLWTCTKLKSPGNVLVVDSPARTSRILVLDGSRDVVEIDSRGAVVERRPLDLPPEAKVSFLRTTVDPAGKRWFVGASIMGQQAHLFDEQWRRQLSYPPLDQPHAGIRDVQIAALEAGGEAEPALFVGYWDEHGAQRVDPAGHLRWSRRDHPTVLSLALESSSGSQERRLLITGDHGRVLAVNSDGDLENETALPQRPVHHLYASDFADPAAAVYCSLTYGSRGGVTAAGLSGKLDELWSYPLPAGVYENEVQLVASGRLLAPADNRDTNSAALGEWLFAGPDGSVHVVASDGSLRDSFGYGQYIAGIGVAQIDGQGALLVSAAGELSAWRVTRSQR